MPQDRPPSSQTTQSFKQNLWTTVNLKCLHFYVLEGEYQAPGVLKNIQELGRLSCPVFKTELLGTLGVPFQSTARETESGRHCNVDSSSCHQSSLIK